MDTYYKAYNEVLNMLVVREVLNEETKKEYILNYSDYANFKSSDPSKLDIKIRNETHNYNVLFFTDDLKSYSTEIQLTEVLLSRLTEEEIGTCFTIVIYPSEEIADSTFKKDNIMYKANKRVQFFTANRMAINILDSRIMPTFKLMKNEAEKKKLLETGKNNMNIIKLIDPVVKYFGAIQGDIFEVVRKKDSGPDISWRRVS